MEERTDDVLGYDVGHESQIRAFAQAAIGPRRTSVGNMLPVSIVERRLRPCRLRITSFMSSALNDVYPQSNTYSNQRAIVP